MNIFLAQSRNGRRFLCRAQSVQLPRALAHSGLRSGGKQFLQEDLICLGDKKNYINMISLQEKPLKKGRKNLTK
jgi:hypothetical protein